MKRRKLCRSHSFLVDPMVHESKDKLGNHCNYNNQAEYLMGGVEVSRLLRYKQAEAITRKPTYPVIHRTTVDTHEQPNKSHSSRESLI